MNIQELKEKLGIATLNLNTCTDKEGVVYKDKEGGEWLRHWDNDSRVEVSVSKKTLAMIKSENPSTLGIQTESREAAGGSLTSHRIVKYTPAEETL